MSRRTENNFKKAVNELLGYQYPEEDIEDDETGDEESYAYEEEEPEVEMNTGRQEQPQPQPQTYAREPEEKMEYIRQPETPPVMTITKMESTIAEDMEIAGNISAKTDLNIYGRVSGNVNCGGSIVLAGSVNGDVAGLDIVIRGSVTGNVTVAGRAVIETGAWVKGDLIAKNIITDGNTEGDMKAEEIVVFKGSSVVTGNIYTKMFEVNSGAKVKGMIHTYD